MKETNNYNVSMIMHKNLINIGTKLSDFEEIENSAKNLKYTILGRGNFGYAEKMKSKKNNLYYAIKKLDKEKVNNKNFHRETEIMISLNHENIVKFYGYFEDKENINKYKQIYKDKKDIEQEKSDKTIFCLVLEYIPNGSLNDYIEKYKDMCKKKNVFTPLKEDFLIKIFKQLLSALIYLQRKRIMHRDIKPDNILFDEKYNTKIADFGLSVLYDDKNPENKNKPEYLFFGYSIVGRYDFIAPEVVEGKKYDFENDIYSLGLTMLWLMSSEKPIKFYINKVTKEKKREIDTSKINHNYNKYLKELVLLMINENPKLRPTADNAYENLIQIEKNIKQFGRTKTFQNFQNIPNFENINNNNINQENNFKKSTLNINTNQFYNNILNMNIKNNELNNKQVINSTPLPEMNTNQILQNNNTICKNTSLIRALQCLCLCIKENLKSKIKTNTNLNIINIMEITSLKISNRIDTVSFVNNINNFRQILSSKNEIFKVQEEISPKIIFSYLFNIMKEDFINNNINWTNNIFNGFTESVSFPKNVFPQIYEKIEKYKKLKSPFVDYFYYIYLEFIKCPKCKYLMQNIAHIPYFVPLPAMNKDRISNLIYNYLNTGSTMDIKCNKCSSHGVQTHAFFSTPKYLMINFDGEIKNEKILDEIIDLTPYSYSNIGPKKYTLYAFIIKEKNKEFKAIIKHESHNNWLLFSGIDTISIYDFNYTHYYYPIVAIYKGLV